MAAGKIIVARIAALADMVTFEGAAGAVVDFAPRGRT